MHLRDMHTDLKVVQHLVAALYNASQDPAGIDTKGFGSIELVIAVGQLTAVGGGEAWTFKLQESDDNAAFTDVTVAGDVLTSGSLAPVTAPDSGTGIFLTVDAAAEDEKTYRVGYIGNKRYVKVVPAVVGAPGNTPLSITAILGSPGLRPTQD